MAVPIDGRHRRRQENRDAVLDALVALWQEGDLAPGTAEIAARAGISPRSLFRYFEDVDDLSRAAVERHLHAAEPLFDLPVDAGDPTAEKIVAVVDARLGLWNAIESGARAGRAVAHRNPVISAQLRDARRLFRDQVRAVFAPELHDRPSALGPIDVLLSFESRELLAEQLGDAHTRQSLITALTALLQG